MFRVLLTTTGTGTEAQGPNSLIMIAIFAVFIIFWYFIALRPQRKKEKELKEKVDKMRVGDEVITIGGLVGKVANIRDDEVTIMTSAANTLVTFKKSAINTVISRDAKKEDKEDKSEPEEKKSGKVKLKIKEKSSDSESAASTEESGADLQEKE